MMLNETLLSQKKGALLAKIFSSTIEDYKLRDFYTYFYTVAKTLTGDPVPYTRTDKGEELVRLVGKTQNVVIEAFRGFFKTDVVLHRAIHLAVTEHENTLILAATDALAQEKVLRIKKFMEASPEMKRFVPSLDKNVPWNGSVLSIVDSDRPIKKEKFNDKTGKTELYYAQRVIATITIQSFKSKTRGGRADNIIMDDLVIEDTSSTIEQINELQKYLSSVVIPIMNKGESRFYVVGTPQHKKDYLAQCMNSKLFDKFFLPIKVDGKFTNLPNAKQLVDAMKHTSKPFVQGSKWFKQQVARMAPNGRENHPSIKKEYYLEIIDSGSSIFNDATLNKAKREHLSFGYTPKLGNRVRVIGIDPSASLDADKAKKENRDYSTVMVADYDGESNDIYILEMGRTRDLAEFEKMVAAMVLRFDPDCLSYEGWALSNVVQGNILNMHKDKKGFLIDTKKKNKERAIIDTLSYFTNSLVHVPYRTEEDHNKADVFFDEFKNIHKASHHDDLADAFVRCIEGALKKIKESATETALDSSIAEMWEGFETPKKKNPNSVRMGTISQKQA